MAKSLGFVVSFDEYNERFCLFGRSDVKYVGWKISMAWGDNRLEASELAREFFELLRDNPVSRDSFRIVETTHVVPKAKDESEAFKRQLFGQSAERYSYTKVYLLVSLGKAAEYRIELETKRENDEASAMREFLTHDLVFEVVYHDNTRFLEAHVKEGTVGHRKLLHKLVEVVHSPLQKKFARRKHNQ